MATPFRILSIDGGGMRGILSGQLLVALEKKLQQKTGNSMARIADYFDMIAGNSTGGILACLYLCPDDNNPLRPMFSAEEAVNLYLKYGQDIFKDETRQKIISQGGFTNDKYPVDHFEALLKKYFKDKKLSELLRPTIIPAYNVTKRSTHFFTQHDAIQDQEFDFFIRDVARATSAAPTYFEPALIASAAGVNYPLVDGGVFANNPALCAFAEARQFLKNRKVLSNPQASDMFIVSIGTGSEKRSLNYDVAKGWGAMGWIFPVLDIVLSGAVDSVDFQLQQIFESTDAAQNYIRINPELGDAKPEMDNASSQNLDALKEAGQASAEVNDAILENIANRLING